SGRDRCHGGAWPGGAHPCLPPRPGQPDRAARIRGAGMGGAAGPGAVARAARRHDLAGGGDHRRQRAVPDPARAPGGRRARGRQRADAATLGSGMPLLLAPFVLLLLLALLLAWPLGLWLRLRNGRARRRAHPLAVTLNAVALAASALLFVAGALVAGLWIDHAAWNAAAGLLAGLALGVAGLRLARF